LKKSGFFKRDYYGDQMKEKGRSYKKKEGRNTGNALNI